MFVYDTVLTSIALVAVFLYGFLRVITYQYMHARNEEWIRDRALENTVFMENVSVMQGIKLFSRESSRLGSWQNAYTAALDSGMKVQKIGITVQFFHGLLLGMENILLLLVGCFAVLGGSLSIGMLMAFISFKDHFYRSVFSLLDKIFEFKLLDIHLERLADIAFTEPESYAGMLLTESGPEERYTFSLEEIAYGYDECSPFLFQNVSLDLNEKEVIAIVGQTGCGKSTLLKIALSLVKPAQGRVMLNGKSIDQHGLGKYRTLVSGVLQNDHLLSGSILENITFFDAVPDIEKAKKAASDAMLITEIALMPMQFNTMVGNMGNAMSGGQVQRILLARAIYQQPTLLVLDEATSHLDVITERAVNSSLRKLELPCLMVAHRPDSVLSADKIFQLTPNGLKPLSHQLFREMMFAPLKDDVITT
jgi:ATP-binding cassette, subfamily B, bacterial CvaB/MchF/RaxB